MSTEPPTPFLQRLMHLAEHWRQSASHDFPHSARRHQLLDCADQLELIVRNRALIAEPAVDAQPVNTNAHQPK